MVQRTKYQQKQRRRNKNKSLTEAEHRGNGACCNLTRQHKEKCKMPSPKQIQFLNASSARSSISTSSKRSSSISVMSVTLSTTVTAIATVASASNTTSGYAPNNYSYAAATTTIANISGSLNSTLGATEANFAGTSLSTATMMVAQDECSIATEELYPSHFGVMLAVPEWEAILTAVVLSVIIVLTIIGNILVILSVFTYKPLRIVQNFFIVSLAVADLTVALLVLPFNVAYSILGRWVFGIHLCKMWLTSDILCCTSSILNLCAIALDRYWAITDPINYAQKRTVGRVLLLIAGVWILSLVISSPPLVGWNDWPEEFTSDTPCELTSERGYVVYSSLGSFFIPLIIMTIVYIEIYIATRRRLRERAQASKINAFALKSGDAEALASSIVSTSKASGFRTFFADHCCCSKDSTNTATPMIQHDQESISSETHINNQAPPSNRIEQHRVVVVTQKKSRRAKIKDSIKHGKTRSKKQQQQPEQSGKNTGSNNAAEHILQAPLDLIKHPPSSDEKDISTSVDKQENSSESQNQPSSDMGASNICITLCTGDSAADAIDNDEENMSLKITPPQSSTGAASTVATPIQKKPSGVYQFIEEKQKISLSKERRAARTLGIIMGVFVICWLPFFLMYVILPFCESCCPTNKFKNFITWLGYINSGLNPVIYTIFNLDYRRAFKRLLGINC